MIRSITVTLEEYNEFIFTSSKTNTIYSFWKDILLLMPKPLYREVKKKATKLVKKDSDKPNYSAYSFVTNEGSSELQNLLNSYTVYVEEDRSSIDKLDPKIFQKKLENVSSLFSNS